MSLYLQNYLRANVSVCVCGKQKGRKRKSILHHFGYGSFCNAVGVEEIAENDGIRMVSLSLSLCCIRTGGWERTISITRDKKPNAGCTVVWNLLLNHLWIYFCSTEEPSASSFHVNASTFMIRMLKDPDPDYEIVKHIREKLTCFPMKKESELSAPGSMSLKRRRKETHVCIH